MKRQIKVKDIKCEYSVNPVGIDVVKPRLSWVIESDKRNQKQTTYRILVATSEENLESDNADLWDSDKVN